MHQYLPHECFSKERCHTAHIWRKTAFNANYVPKTAPQILYISKNHLQTDCVSPYEKYSVLDYRIAINLKNKRIDTLISILKKTTIDFLSSR